MRKKEKHTPMWETKTETRTQRTVRFPSIDGLSCSQCERSFEDKKVIFGGAYMDTPVCEDCAEALLEMDNSLHFRAAANPGASGILSTFTQEEAQMIFKKSVARATEWAADHPEYMEAVKMLKPYFWAKQAYKLPDRPETEK